MSEMDFTELMKLANENRKTAKEKAQAISESERKATERLIQQRKEELRNKQRKHAKQQADRQNAELERQREEQKGFKIPKKDQLTSGASASKSSPSSDSGSGVSKASVEAFLDKKKTMEKRRALEVLKTKEKLIKDRIAEAGGKVTLRLAKQHGLSVDEMERRYLPSAYELNAAKRRELEEREVEEAKQRNGLGAKLHAKFMHSVNSQSGVTDKRSLHFQTPVRKDSKNMTSASATPKSSSSSHKPSRSENGSGSSRKHGELSHSKKHESSSAKKDSGGFKSTESAVASKLPSSQSTGLSRPDKNVANSDRHKPTGLHAATNKLGSDSRSDKSSVASKSNPAVNSASAHSHPSKDIKFKAAHTAINSTASASKQPSKDMKVKAVHSAVNSTPSASNQPSKDMKVKTAPKRPAAPPPLSMAELFKLAQSNSKLTREDLLATINNPKPPPVAAPVEKPVDKPEYKPVSVGIPDRVLKRDLKAKAAGMSVEEYMASRASLGAETKKPKQDPSSPPAAASYTVHPSRTAEGRKDKRGRKDDEGRKVGQLSASALDRLRKIERGTIVQKSFPDPPPARPTARPLSPNSQMSARPKARALSPGCQMSGATVKKSAERSRDPPDRRAIEAAYERRRHYDSDRRQGPAYSNSGRQRYPESDDDDDEDSDLDDFIDDSQPMDADDYQTHLANTLKEKYKYDKSKYKNESKYDDRSMEVRSFSKLEKEERKSSRMGMLEDMLAMKHGSVGV